MPLFDELVNLIGQLPGIGPKAATRIALYLTKNNKVLSSHLSSSLDRVVSSISECPLCGNISEKGKICSICADNQREGDKVAVVSSIADLMAIDKSSVFKGRYFIFDDMDVVFENKDIFQSKVDNLIKFINYLNKTVTVKEIILALPYNIDSEVVSQLLKEDIQAKMPEIRLSRIALGMPIGADFDYTDKLTIMRSFKGRTGL